MDGHGKGMDGSDPNGNTLDFEAKSTNLVITALESDSLDTLMSNNPIVIDLTIDEGPELMDGIDGLVTGQASDEEIFEVPLAKKIKKIEEKLEIKEMKKNDEIIEIDDKNDGKKEIKEEINGNQIDLTDLPDGDEANELLRFFVKDTPLTVEFLNKLSTVDMNALGDKEKNALVQVFFNTARMIPALCQEIINLKKEIQTLTKPKMTYSTIAALNGNVNTARAKPVSAPTVAKATAPLPPPVFNSNPDALKSFVRKEPRKFSIVFVRGLGNRRISHLRRALFESGIDTKKIFNIDYVGKSIVEFHVLQDFKVEFCKLMKEKINVQVCEANPLDPQFCPSKVGKDDDKSKAVIAAAALCKTRIEARLKALDKIQGVPGDHLNYLNAIKRQAELQLKRGTYLECSFNAPPMRIGRASAIAIEDFWNAEDLGKSTATEAEETTFMNDQ